MKVNIPGMDPMSIGVVVFTWFFVFAKDDLKFHEQFIK